MPTVTLTVSDTIAGSDFADTLAGSGTGIDMGNVATGSYTPLVDSTVNSGQQDVFIYHDGSNKITDLKTYLGQYGVQTGFTYGGAASASADFAKILNMGNVSNGGVPNNSDGLSGGFHVEMDWDVSQTTQFDPSRIGTVLRIYGDNGGASSGDGRSITTAIDIRSEAMSRNNAGIEVAPSAPVLGQIGAAGDTVLGDRAHLRLRFFVRSDETTSGVIQWEWIVIYAFTS